MYTITFVTKARKVQDYDTGVHETRRDDQNTILAVYGSRAFNV